MKTWTLNDSVIVVVVCLFALIWFVLFCFVFDHLALKGSSLVLQFCLHEEEMTASQPRSVLRAERLSFDIHLSTSSFDVLFEMNQSERAQTGVCFMSL